MKKSTKAVLLSGLVFPGLGHLYLKRWVTGVLLSGVAAYAVWFIISVTVGIASDIAQKIESDTIPPDIETVTHLVSQQLAGSAQATNMATITLAVCWVVGIVGCYWQGRSRDKAEAADKHD